METYDGLKYGLECWILYLRGVCSWPIFFLFSTRIALIVESGSHEIMQS